MENCGNFRPSRLRRGDKEGTYGDGTKHETPPSPAAFHFRLFLFLFCLALSCLCRVFRIFLPLLALSFFAMSCIVMRVVVIFCISLSCFFLAMYVVVPYKGLSDIG